MSNSINTNIAAYYAQENITTASNAATENVARLSSGNAIVEASDNVAALAVGTSLGSQVNALTAAQTNAAQGSSLLQVADGALAQIQSILQQQQSLALQAESGSLTDTDRGFLNQQFQQLTDEINALASGTTFNGVSLINGSIATGGSNNPLQDTSVVIGNTNGTVAEATYPVTTAGAIDDTTSSTDPAGETLNLVGLTTESVFSTLGNITQASGVSDTNLTHTNLADAVISSTASNNGYIVTADINGHNYVGDLVAATGGKIAAGTILSLAGGAGEGTINLTVTTAATEATTTAANTIVAGALATGSVTHGSFTTGTTVDETGQVNSVTVDDPALFGALGDGTFGVYASSAVGVAGTIGSGGSATGYTIDYTLNGITYQGFLANDTTAGHGIVTAAATASLTATSNTSQHAAINLTVGADAFGDTADEFVDQSSNILAELQTNFQNATALTATGTVSATIATGATDTTLTAGGATVGGLSSTVSAYNDIGKNDTALVGDLSKGAFQVSSGANGGYAVSYTINDSTYSGFLSAAQIASSTATTNNLVLNNGNGSIIIGVTGNGGTPAANSATETATALQTGLTALFAGNSNGPTTAYAIHTVATALETDSNGNTVSGSAITATETNGTLLSGFTGADINLQSATFTGTNLPPVSGWTATGTGTNVQFSVNVDGTTFSSAANVSTAADLSAINTGVTGDIILYQDGNTSSDEKLTLDVSNLSGSALITTTGEVANIVSALNGAFGSGGSAGGLTFQLGTTSAANVNVNLASATTSSLFNGASLNISTAAGASTAATAVTSALNTVTAQRATTGAYESQFNFASAALQSSVQNETAAESQLLDTNVATESTTYATNQVKIQAGISVLAQANQQSQSLLKLIG